MRILLSLLLIASVACTPKKKGSPVGTKERLLELSAGLRAQIEKDLPGCGYGSSVGFDGTSEYNGRAIGPMREGKKVLLIYKLDGETWTCDDAKSSVPCAADKDLCAKK